MIVRIGKILRIENNGKVDYININSFSLKELNAGLNLLDNGKLIVRIPISELEQSIEEILALTDETEEGEKGANGDAGINGADGNHGLNGTNGENGINGTDGLNGRDGQNGANGKDGQDGKDGKDFEVSSSLISEIRGKDGEDGADGTNGINGLKGSDGTNGINGVNGLNGSDGIDGQSFVWAGEYSKEDTYEQNEVVQYQGASWIAITDVPANEPPLNPSHNAKFWDLASARGIQGIQGLSGANGAAGQGVPIGGTAGQHLAKIDGTNFNTEWVTPSSGGGATLRNVTVTDTFATASETINCTANTFTVNLPTAVGIQGTTYTLVNSGTGVITLDANGTETINGSLTIEIKKQYVSRTVQSDNANWIII